MDQIKAESLRIVRFGLVGALATLSHATFALIALSVFRFSAVESNLIGFALAFSVSLIGHTYFTYRATYSWQAALRFSLVAAFVALGTTALIWIGQQFSTLSAQALVMCAALIGPIASYLLHRAWTFARHDKT